MNETESHLSVMTVAAKKFQVQFKMILTLHTASAYSKLNSKIQAKNQKTFSRSSDNTAGDNSNMEKPPMPYNQIVLRYFIQQIELVLWIEKLNPPAHPQYEYMHAHIIT